MKRRWSYLPALVCAVLVLVLYVMGRSGLRFVVVSGVSMEPTLRDGEWVLMHSVLSPAGLEEDHPVCWVQLPDGHNIIKRLVGYPGQTVTLVDGDTYVDGDLLMTRSTPSWDNIEFELGEDEYLFLGDNRAESIDAREWQPPVLKFSAIKGQLPDSGLV